MILTCAEFFCFLLFFFVSDLKLEFFMQNWKLYCSEFYSSVNYEMTKKLQKKNEGKMVCLLFSQ